MADTGHYRRAGGTRQGIYVLASSGILCGSINSNDPERVRAMLEAALAVWEELGPEERRLAADVDLEPEHRWEMSYPEDGLILASVNRDLPGSEGEEGGGRRAWNRDRVWFTRDEALGFLPQVSGSANSLVVGVEGRVAPEVAMRLARFHLVDNVRGQTLPFAASEVRDARLVAHVIARDGDLVHLGFEGETHAVADGAWLLDEDSDWKPRTGHPHALTARLAGRATFDAAAGRFTHMELVALAERRGRTGLNGRARGPETSRIGFVFSLAAPGAAPEQDPARRIPPTFLDFYEADWVDTTGHRRRPVR